MSKLITVLLLIFMTQTQAQSLPQGFSFLTEVDPTIIESVRYYGPDNFMGRPVPGYTANRIIITTKAAEALKQVNASLQKHGYTLVVYDAYRPQRSVNAFVEWSKHPEDDIAKPLYYPTLTKPEIFEEGYISPHSQHTGGSTVDLTIIKQDQKLKPVTIKSKTLSNSEKIPFLDDNTVDMGSSFDLFHRVSHSTSILINPQQQAARDLLRAEMEKAGFQPYDTEWWHYHFRDEPFPNTVFDFVAS